MDETVADFVVDIPTAAEGMAGLDAEVTLADFDDPSTVSRQERLFSEDLSRWTVMPPGAADTAMNPFASGPTGARLKKSNNPEDLQAQLRALSARNAFLSLALDAAVAESSNLRSEHAELATIAAQATVFRQRYDAEIAEARQAHQRLTAEFEGARSEIARVQAELQSSMATVEERSARWKTEQETLGTAAAEANAARQKVESDLAREQRKLQQTTELLDQHRAEVTRLQAELRTALNASDDRETRLIAEQVEFTAAAAEATAARQRVETELGRLQKKHRQTTTSLENARSEAARLKEALRLADTGRSELESKLVAENDAAQSAVADANAVVQRLEADLTEARQQQQHSEELAAQARGEVARLHDEVTSAIAREKESESQRLRAQVAFNESIAEAAQARDKLERQLAESRLIQQQTLATIELLHSDSLQLRQQLDAANSSVEDARSRWNAERATLITAAEEPAAKLRKLEAELGEARQAQQLLGGGIGQARAEIERLSRLQPRLEAVERERDALRVSKEQAVDQLKHLLDVARKEAADATSRIEQAEAERERMAELVVANNASVQQLRNELESLQSQLSQQDSARTVATKGDTSAEVRRLQARIDAQAENRQRYAQEMRETRARVAELEALCRQLQSQINASVS